MLCGICFIFNKTNKYYMLNKIVNIAKEAGQLIRENFRTNFEVEFKTSETNLVTAIDKKSEKLIIEYINKEFPGHKVLAEESGGEYKSADYLWVIDPIDGTNNYAHGLPIFCVSIGVQKAGDTIYGVVYDVMRDAVYHAEKGGGAYCNSRKMKVSKNDKMGRSLLVTGFPYEVATKNPEHILKIFSSFMLASRGLRRLGSAALDMCYVADGVFDGYWESFLYPWDMCAGQLLVQEAGGLVTDFNGNKRDIFGENIIASNGRVHGQMLDIVNS